MAPPSFFIFLLLIFTPVSLSRFSSFSTTPSKLKPDSPLSPKSSLLRYWNRKISNNKPLPLFFTSKLSPLSPFDFTKYCSFSSSQLSSSLSTFCTSAHILCTSYNNLTASLSSHYTHSNILFYPSYAEEGTAFSNSFKNISSYDTPSNIQLYADSTNCAEEGTAFSNSFKNLSSHENNLKGENEFNFKSDLNACTVTHSDGVTVEEMKAKRPSGEVVNKWLVEPGTFFRESNLKKGNIMPMPDLRDKMPPRSYLPQAIASKITFTAENVRTIFAIPEDTTMGKAVGDTMNDCNLAPSKGEIKKCGTSAEDIIDFAVSVLGPDVVVRSCENTKGSKKNIMIGDVKGVNGGEITESVSCHQSLFPYLVYYCHSVPKVRVYEVDILDVENKEKINHGVAICHIDTSAWSPRHEAFLSLASGPGKIEVCHWISEGDMTWTRAD